MVLTDMKGGALRKLVRKALNIDVVISSDKKNTHSLPLVVDDQVLDVLKDSD